MLQNLEMKLDLLMDRGPSRLASKGVSSYSMALAARCDDAYSAEGTQAARRPMRLALDKEAFRKMYIRRLEWIIR